MTLSPQKTFTTGAFLGFEIYQQLIKYQSWDPFCQDAPEPRTAWGPLGPSTIPTANRMSPSGSLWIPSCAFWPPSLEIFAFNPTARELWKTGGFLGGNWKGVPNWKGWFRGEVGGGLVLESEHFFLFFLLNV